MAKRKSHNPHKRAQRFFGRSRVWSWESDIDADGTRIAYAESFHGLGWVPLSPDVTAHLVRRPQNWIVCCRAACLAPDGTEWIETEIRQARSLALNELEELYREMHAAVLACVHPAHIIDVGWIAHTWRDNTLLDDDRWYLQRLCPFDPARRQAWLNASETDHGGRVRAQ